MLLNCLVFYIFIFSIEGVRDIELTDDSDFLLQCTYENNCDEDNIFRAPPGYFLRIVVKEVNINGANGDFLLLKPGTQTNDRTGLIFIHHINHARTYVSLTNDLLIRFSANEMDNRNGTYTGFLLTVQRSARNDENNVIVINNDIISHSHDEILVNMAITIPIEDALPIFRQIVAEMGNDYVSNEDHLTLEREISADDVEINRIMDCPIHWPNRKSCFQIAFALPVVQSQDSSYYGSYQLNSHHLNRMWRNAQFHFCVENNPNILIYYQHTRDFMAWLGASLAIVVLFAIAYLLIGDMCTHRIQDKMLAKKKLDSGKELEITSRTKDETLDPHPYQTVPPLFYSNIPVYNPDAARHVRILSGRPDSMDDNLLDQSNINYFDVDKSVLAPDNTPNKTREILP